MADYTMFDENALRAELVKQWGAYGAHVEVFDMVRAERDEMRELVLHYRALLARCGTWPTGTD